MSKKFYSEWLFPVADYFECLNKNEKRFEILIPISSSILATTICAVNDISYKAIIHLNSLLPNVFSILIGFTISAIAIIISTSDDPAQTINKKMQRYICNKQIIFKQWFLSNLIYYTICEIFFLILTFILPLVQFLTHNINLICNVIIFVYCYSLLRILFGIIKIVTKLYQVFFNKCVDK